MLNFYDDHFAQLMRLQTAADHQLLLDFLLRVLPLAPGQRILDQGCGIGKISHFLAGAGFQVFGIDQNPAYIAEARQQASSAHFYAADARRWTAPQPVELVISWHTSFGHHHHSADNLALLEAAWHSLKPGGHLLLDYPNFHQTRANFQAVFVQHFELPTGRLEVRRHSQLSDQHLLQDWEFIYPDGQRAVCQGEICTYTPEVLVELLQQAGFESPVAFADLNAQPFDKHQPRWIGKARKPLSASAERQTPQHV